MEAESSATRLRKLIQGPTLGIPCPCCHDALSAKLVESAGFEACFVSGFTTSASTLAQPDCQLMTFTEMITTGRQMLEATQSLPLIVDADNGYGNAANVTRTVTSYAASGMAGLLLEDQRVPKSCGHVGRKEVVSRVESVARIKAAVDARDAMPEHERIVLIGRTDAKQAESFDEALWRISAFADLGVDMVFVDALETVGEMEAVCRAAGVPVMANMLEGGLTPTDLSLEDLSGLGFKLVAYPLSLLSVSISAMQEALVGLKTGRVPTNLMPFEDIKGVVGFDAYAADLAQREGEASAFVSQREEAAKSEPEEPEEEPREVEAEPATAVVLAAEIVGQDEDTGGGGERVDGTGQLMLKVTNVATGETEIEVTLPGSVGRDAKDLVALLSTFGLNLSNSNVGEPMSTDKDYLIDSVNDGKRIEVWIA